MIKKEKEEPLERVEGAVKGGRYLAAPSAPLIKKIHGTKTKVRYGKRI